jgi:hypothetical protein
VRTARSQVPGTAVPPRQGRWSGVPYPIITDPRYGRRSLNAALAAMRLTEAPFDRRPR